jgi:uncharacterized membrane protein
MLKVLINIVIGCLLVAYPLIVYFGLQHFSIRVIAPILLGAVVLRFALTHKAQRTMPWLLPGTVLGASCLALATLSNNAQISLLYPVIMSLVMLTTFALSLYKGPSVIESFAALQNEQTAKRKKQVAEPLTKEVSAYCKNVTRVWCVFFAINAFIAGYTVWQGDLAMWTLYNGLVSYLLMGILFAAELVVRFFVKKKHQSLTAPH